ncbi:MAG: ribonucleotide-diphosphate reductase subunit alpha [Nitrospirae bacterium]|nr:ribonucleotide-diphosphate reductase subunit alpha [Nitrospirota bacterium]
MKSAVSAGTATGAGLRLSENSLKVLEKRYLKRNEDGTVVETAVDMFQRVARTIAQADANYGKTPDVIDRTAQEFYRMMTSLEFLPNSPTLMNAGRELGQLSACFVLPVGDSMDEIFESVKHAALIHKSGGGTGFSFSRIRPRNDVVKSTKGVSSGPISFMTVFDAATETVKQGGTRRGANMGILSVDHPDILDFVTCKQQNDRLNNFNISVAFTDPFMQAVDKDTEYDLVSPRNKTVVRKLKARKVFDTIVNMAWRNGDPGIVFLDRINQYNPTPHIGRMESTNPCGEQPLLPYESCNLGSVNLATMVTVKDGKPAVDYDKLRHTVREGVHFLDNVIDVNKYPIEKIAENTRANRKIGLGVMGFSDMLLQLGIPYNSEEAVRVGGSVMQFLTEEGRKMSEELAAERSTFPNFKGSIYDRPGRRPVRNATVSTIAPTGTLSIIAGCSSGVEPLFGLTFVRRVLDGAELVEVNPIFEKVARERGFFSDSLMKEIAEHGGCTGIASVPEDIQRVFVTAHDISPEWHVRMQAAFQQYTDNAVSKTVNFPHSATAKDVEKVYMLAYQLGCKGVTIYRDGSRDEQVLSTGATGKARKAAQLAAAVPGVPAEEKKPRKRPTMTHGVTQKIPTGCGNLYITINEDEEGICEVFSTMGKSGGCASSQSEAVSRMVSLALRSGVSIDSIIRQVKGIRCPSPGWGEMGRQILSCPDAIGLALERYNKDNMGPRKQNEMPAAAAESAPTVPYVSSDCTAGENTNHLGLCPECPDCGGLLEFGEGCAVCRGCGFSKCG